MGTQKNRLIEGFFLSTPKHMFQLMGKEINEVLGAQTFGALLKYQYLMKLPVTQILLSLIFC